MMKNLPLAALLAACSAATCGPARAADDAPERHESQDAGQVLTGVDVLRRDGFALLAGRRVGLITNHTGLAADGASTLDLLHQAPNVELTALFSPEHGFRGRLDTAHIADDRDGATGLPIYSLYGETRKPTAESLKGVDTLVFDIQDIGARFYTYLSTMGLAMEAAAEHGLRFLVLDRPNPIGGVLVEGPLLDAGRESFIAYHRLPIRHGMTLGELALLIKQERGLDLDLRVVKLEGWRRADYFDACRLTWINPSPNMRSLTQALLYPGVGLLETTNVSVGRGTDTPFEVIGAPWIEGRQLAAALNAAQLPGARFVPIVFTPSSSTHAEARCNGVNVIITDREVFRPLAVGWEIALQLRRLYPADWKLESYDRLLGSAEVMSTLRAGGDRRAIEAVYEPELQKFLRARQAFLLYE